MSQITSNTHTNTRDFNWKFFTFCIQLNFHARRASKKKSYRKVWEIKYATNNHVSHPFLHFLIHNFFALQNVTAVANFCFLFCGFWIHLLQCSSVHEKLLRTWSYVQKKKLLKWKWIWKGFFDLFYIHKNYFDVLNF